jgi:hypothetical protein
VYELRSDPLLSSLSAEGEFTTALRDRIVQARDLLEREQAEAGDEIWVRAAQSRLAYLLAVAADHGVAIASTVAPGSVRVSVEEMAR